jgi:hypothetical protein
LCLISERRYTTVKRVSPQREREPRRACSRKPLGAENILVSPIVNFL